MGENYENKSINTIKQDIKQEFKRIEDNTRWWYRDDQEIYEAWENMIDKYISQLSSASWIWVSNEKRWVKDGKAQLVKSENLYKNEALSYFKKAKANFSKRWKEVVKEKSYLWTWIYITSRAENEKQINQVAASINNAEEAALKKIKMVCNPKQEQTNAVEHSSVEKDNKWNVKVKNWEVVRQKPIFTQSKDWIITFTDRSNPMKIHQALGNLFNDKDKIYRIDYSKCTNKNIKAKMQNLTWWLSCWIKYDKTSKTYVLTDKTWGILSDRALVWEWVTLKQDTIMENQETEDENGWLTADERQTLEILRSKSEPFEFDANNYRYYEQYSIQNNQDICSAYAYWVVSDILAKKWYCLNAKDVSAWEIAHSSHIKWKFNIDEIDNINPQQQILDAPAWTFFTVKFDGTRHKDHWVSHVMVSLWNGVYTDLFWPRIRKIDFKSEVKFSWKKFTYWWWSYTITEDSRLVSPNFSSLPTWTEQRISWEDLTLNEFVEKVYESTKANKNYIMLLIANQNNLSASEFNSNKKYNSISVKIITKGISNLELDIKDWNNDVANQFLDSLKVYKKNIMDHYPNLTNHEYDEIAKRAMGILYQESKSWDSIKYHLKEDILHNDKVVVPIAWAVPVVWPVIWKLFLVGKNIYWGQKWWWSRWYTQIKFDQVFKPESKQFLRETFGINNENALTDPEKCWIATIVGLIDKYYDYIVPMKSESFRTHDAEIIEVTFNNWEKECIAKGKYIKRLKKVRTEEDIENTIKERWAKNGWEDHRRSFTRPGIVYDDDFFDFLYYARNMPGELDYWTATPQEKGSLAYRYSRHNDNNLIA